MKVSDEMFEKGMKKLAFMGREKTMMDQKRLYPDLYRLTVGYLFGEIWNRPRTFRSVTGRSSRSPPTSRWRGRPAATTTIGARAVSASPTRRSWK